MTNIVLIGVGKLGSRHLQALSQIQIGDTNLFVVDPSISALNLGKERFNEMPSNKNITSVNYFTDLDNLSINEIDLAIVATTSEHRKLVIKALSKTYKINNAEKLKDEAKNILGEYESKVSKSKEEIKNLIQRAEKQAESNIIKTNEEFHNIVENRKKAAEEKIRQMKAQAIKDVRNSSVDIAISSVEKIINNSIDKKKLDKIYISSIDEAKKILKNKSI